MEQPLGSLGLLRRSAPNDRERAVIRKQAPNLDDAANCRRYLLEILDGFCALQKQDSRDVIVRQSVFVLDGGGRRRWIEFAVEPVGERYLRRRASNHDHTLGRIKRHIASFRNGSDRGRHLAHILRAEVVGQLKCSPAVRVLAKDRGAGDGGEEQT